MHNFSQPHLHEASQFPRYISACMFPVVRFPVANRYGCHREFKRFMVKRNVAFGHFARFVALKEEVSDHIVPAEIDLSSATQGAQKLACEVARVLLLYIHIPPDVGNEHFVSPGVFGNRLSDAFSHVGGKQRRMLCARPVHDEIGCLNCLSCFWVYLWHTRRTPDQALELLTGKRRSRLNLVSIESLIDKIKLAYRGSGLARHKLGFPFYEITVFGGCHKEEVFTPGYIKDSSRDFKKAAE